MQDLFYSSSDKLSQQPREGREGLFALDEDTGGSAENLRLWVETGPGLQVETPEGPGLQVETPEGPGL